MGGRRYERFEEIDWARWKPDDHATLCFVIRRGEILLIRKKRGLGAGKINGPGGKLEPGESALECAVRETQEELGVTPVDVELAVRRGFGLVEVARGEPIETDEAIPRWTGVDEVPYHEMWADDVLWFPHLFAHRQFAGRFLFDSETDAMLGHAFDLP